MDLKDGAITDSRLSVGQPLNAREVDMDVRKVVVTRDSIATSQVYFLMTNNF